MYGQGQGGQIKFFPMHNSKATTTTSGAGFLKVAIARGTGFIQSRVILRFLPGFSEAHEIYLSVNDMVMNEGCLVVEGLCIEKFDFDFGRGGGGSESL